MYGLWSGVQPQHRVCACLGACFWIFGLNCCASFRSSTRAWLSSVQATSCPQALKQQCRSCSEPSLCLPWLNDLLISLRCKETGLFCKSLSKKSNQCSVSSATLFEGCGLRLSEPNSSICSHTPTYLCVRCLFIIAVKHYKGQAAV